MALVLERLRNNRWRLVRPYRRFSARYGLAIEAPTDFETDLASIPRPFLPIVDDDEIAGPAVIHDYLYRTPDQCGTLTRKKVDLILADLMKEDGIGWWKRHLVRSAVRFGGRGAWRKHR